MSVRVVLFAFILSVGIGIVLPLIISTDTIPAWAIAGVVAVWIFILYHLMKFCFPWNQIKQIIDENDDD